MTVRAAAAASRTRPSEWMLRARRLLLAGGGAALVAGLWTGLARAGVGGTPGPAAAHGLLMALGFLGALIALERAVALRSRWAYTAPALSIAATTAVLADAPTAIGGALYTLAGIVVCLVYAPTLRRDAESHFVLMTAGALCWVAAAGSWTLGRSPVRVAPLLAGFLVLTIVGERLELSRLRVPTAAARRPLVVAAGVFGLGVLTTQVYWSAGLLVVGVGLLAQTAWLVRHDVARITIHRLGLPRFAAACMLAGYAWLAAGGLLWFGLGAGIDLPLLRDAALHAVFLGFVMSMVMGHAPIILPAVLTVPLPYQRMAWVPLGLLHASLAVRVVADLAGSNRLRAGAAVGNVVALVLFVVVAAGTVAWSRGRAGRASDLRIPDERSVTT